MSWSGYSNGNIPLALMDEWHGLYGQPDAIAALKRIDAAFYAATGRHFVPNEIYRNMATQVYYRQLYLSGRGNPAAIPGTSKHGEGLAADLNYPMNSWLSADQLWWLAHESQFQLSSAQGRGDNEAWHKVYIGPTTTPAGGGSTPIVEKKRDSDMPNPYWDTSGTGWFGAVGVSTMEQYDVLVRYWNSTPDKADKFNGTQVGWIRNYLGLNNAYGIPKPTMPTFDTAKLASAVADALKAAKLTTIADPASLKAPLDDAFSRALNAWAKTIADQTKANIGFDPTLLANAVAQQLQISGIVVTPDTQAVQDAVSAAIARATSAIATATA